MNLLAHLYLSPNNTEIMLGNFFADHIKGNKMKHYSEDIQKGVFLHRAIDTFTDTHDVVKISKRRLNKRYGHYGGVIIDVFYDHFLAQKWQSYSQIPLDIYTSSIYQLLEENKSILPEKTKELLPYIIKYNWLFSYQYTSAIGDVLKGLDRRTKGISKMSLATEDLEIHRESLEKDFEVFFEDLIQFVKIEIKNI